MHLLIHGPVDQGWRLGIVGRSRHSRRSRNGRVRGGRRCSRRGGRCRWRGRGGRACSRRAVGRSRRAASRAGRGRATAIRRNRCGRRAAVATATTATGAKNGRDGQSQGKLAAGYKLSVHGHFGKRKQVGISNGRHPRYGQRPFIQRRARSCSFMTRLRQGQSGILQLASSSDEILPPYLYPISMLSGSVEPSPLGFTFSMKPWLFSVASSAL